MAGERPPQAQAPRPLSKSPYSHQGSAVRVHVRVWANDGDGRRCRRRKLVSKSPYICAGAGAESRPQSRGTRGQVQASKLRGEAEQAREGRAALEAQLLRLRESCNQVNNNNNNKNKNKNNKNNKIIIIIIIIIICNQRESGPHVLNQVFTR